VTVIKVSRWEWVGHVAGMDGGRTVMKLRKAKPGGGTKAWKPRLRWMDDVELDLMTMGVKRKRTRALDRVEWHLSKRKTRPNLKGMWCYRRRRRRRIRGGGRRRITTARVYTENTIIIQEIQNVTNYFSSKRHWMILPTREEFYSKHFTCQPSFSAKEMVRGYLTAAT